MSVITKNLSLETEGEPEMVNITSSVEEALVSTGLQNGIISLFVPGSTAALTTIEYEPGLVEDFPQMMERIAPKEIGYEHDRAWHDGNGHSHVRASLVGPSLTIPFAEGKLLLGTWQQLVFVEMDVRPRSRKVILQIIGENASN